MIGRDRHRLQRKVAQQVGEHRVDGRGIARDGDAAIERNVFGAIGETDASEGRDAIEGVTQRNVTHANADSSIEWRLTRRGSCGAEQDCDDEKRRRFHLLEALPRM